MSPSEAFVRLVSHLIKRIQPVLEGLESLVDFVWTPAWS